MSPASQLFAPEPAPLSFEPGLRVKIEFNSPVRRGAPVEDEIGLLQSIFGHMFAGYDGAKITVEQGVDEGLYQQ